MFGLIFSTLKKRLQGVQGIKYADWYMSQYDEVEAEGGGALLWDTPAILIEMEPVSWETIGGNIQSADLVFSVHLVSDSYLDDGSRMTDQTLNHNGLDTLVFRSLMNFRAYLSYVPGYEALANSTSDRVLLESIVRMSSQMDHAMNRQLVTVTTYKTRIYDYSATKLWTTVMANVDVVAEIDKPSI